ncbi:MAG TPA: oligosaccharide flippase family protein [Candidatus Absconditabacterales bacterium]|nr:oligosaccharide flippase family protein [Candidatus Absconditabacterales bacterium]HNG97538.1 oligosaccharide flippase family protein [Candidatus Absconditabacterales bacterium]
MFGSHQIIKDAFWQILGRVFSALGGLVTIKLMTPFLGPLRYGDYNTILKYFAIWSALADLGLYTIALRELGKLKDRLIKQGGDLYAINHPELNKYYSQFMGSRVINLFIVYGIALIVAYLIPSYHSNPFILRGLPLGMLFSATFVLGYFFQLPHQLYWSMHHTSISLIIARLGQIGLLLLIIFGFDVGEVTNPTRSNIIIFILILCTVVGSGVFQIAYQWRTGKRFMSLSRKLDRTFFRNHITENRKYGVGYFMSSFHTLAVGLLLSRMYPTKDGFIFVGVWGLAMTLVEILLIIPSSLGNSALHKIAGKSLEEKKSFIGSLLIIVRVIGGLIALNFGWFSSEIISFVGGTKYLASTLGSRGSDSLLGRLGVALLLTFTKQIFNYMLIATDHQNKLFQINTWGVIIGIGAAIGLVYYYGLIGGIIGQLWVELLYVIGGIRVAWRYNIVPIITQDNILKVLLRLGVGSLGGYLIHYFQLLNGSQYADIILIIIYNLILVGLVYRRMKRLLGST